MFFTPCDNYNTLFFTKIFRYSNSFYSDFFIRHVTAFFDASALKEVIEVVLYSPQ